MSTLSTANIQSKAANTPPVIKDLNGAEIGQTVRAWVHYDQTTDTVRDSFNVTSVTDEATGRFTITFTKPMPNATYAFAGSVGHISPSGSTSAIFSVELPDSGALSSVMTTTSLRVEVNYVTASSNRSTSDREFVSVIVFGG